MIIKEAFGRVYCFEKNIAVPEKLASTLKSQIDNLLDIQKSYEERFAHGKALTTVAASGPSSDGIRVLPVFWKLHALLMPYFIAGAENLGVYKQANPKLVRAWANKMFAGSFGSTHNHPNCDAVFIFYLNAPSMSAKLILADTDKYDIFDNDIPMDKKHYIDTETNMLICHDSTIIHAVSEHQSDEPRTCIIFEFTF